MLAGRRLYVASLRFLIHLVLIQYQLRNHRLHLLLLLKWFIHCLVLRNYPVRAALVLNWLFDKVSRLIIRTTFSLFTWS